MLLDWFMVKKWSKSIVKCLAIGRLGTSYYEIHFKEKLKMVEMYASRPIFSIFFSKTADEMSFIIRIIQNYVRRYSINGLNKNKIVFSLLSCLW